MVAENRKLKVFLCHSKDDKSKVRELYHRLVADGFDPWLDEEKLMPGQEWDLEIRKAVRESDVVVVCLSKGSCNPPVKSYQSEVDNSWQNRNRSSCHEEVEVYRKPDHEDFEGS